MWSINIVVRRAHLFRANFDDFQKLFRLGPNQNFIIIVRHWEQHIKNSAKSLHKQG